MGLWLIAAAGGYLIAHCINSRKHRASRRPPQQDEGNDARSSSSSRMQELSDGLHNLQALIDQMHTRRRSSSSMPGDAQSPAPSPLVLSSSNPGAPARRLLLRMALEAAAGVRTQASTEDTSGRLASWGSGVDSTTAAGGAAHAVGHADGLPLAPTWGSGFSSDSLALLDGHVSTLLSPSHSDDGGSSAAATASAQVISRLSQVQRPTPLDAAGQAAGGTEADLQASACLQEQEQLLLAAQAQVAQLLQENQHLQQQVMMMRAAMMQQEMQLAESDQLLGRLQTLVDTLSQLR